MSEWEWHLGVTQPSPTPTWQEVLPISPFDPENEPRVILDKATDGTTATRMLTFMEKVRHDSPTFKKNQIARLWAVKDLTTIVVHWGRIENITHVGDPGNERIVYQSHGPLSLMNRIPWIRGGRARVSINLTDPDDENFDDTLQDLTIEEIVNLYCFEMASYLNYTCHIFGVWFDPGFPELSPKDLVYNAPEGGLDILDGLLRWTPGWIRRVSLDYYGVDQHRLEILDVSALDSLDITLGGGNWIQTNNVESSCNARYGALEIIGKDELDDELLYFDPDNPDGTGGPNQLVRNWNGTLEATWTPELANTDPEYGKVFKAFKQPATDTKEWARATVRATQNTGVKLWTTFTIQSGLGGASEIRSRIGYESYNKAAREIVLNSPIYEESGDPGIWTVRPLWMRLCRTSGPVSIREPSSGYGGKAYTEDGIIDVWTKYAENLVKLTFHGTTTAAGTGGTIKDSLLGIKWYDLSGKILTIGGNPYTITTHSNQHIETDGSFASSPGTPYTIAALDTEAEFQDVIEALFPGMTASPKPVSLSRHDVESMLEDLVDPGPKKINIKAADLHSTGWESLEAVVMDWTLDFGSNTFSLSADDASSLSVQSYSDLVAQRDLVTTVEELEIYVRRNRNHEEDSGGSTGDPSGGKKGISVHQHTGDTGDISGPLSSTETEFEGSGHNGPLALYWDSVSSSWLAYPAPHEHKTLASDSKGGGPLKSASTAVTVGVSTGTIQFVYYSGTGYSLSKPSKHYHQAASTEQDGSGGPLYTVQTYWYDGTREKLCNFVYYSALNQMIPAQSLWDETE